MLDLEFKKSTSSSSERAEKQRKGKEKENILKRVIKAGEALNKKIKYEPLG